MLFDPALLQDKNKGLVVEIFTKLLDNSVIPKQVNRIGFRIDVEKEIKAELNKASEQDCKKAVEIIRKVLSS